MYKRMMFVVLALLLVASVVSVGASSPLYSMQFDTEAEMTESLSVYAAAFPNVDGYLSGDLSKPRDGYHLEEKGVMIPLISDGAFSPESFSYAESSWGSGVNCVFASYSKNGESNRVRFITYYDLSEKAVSEKLDSVKNSTDDEVIYEGSCNSYPYVARDIFDETGGFVRCIYEIAVADYYVTVYSKEAYSEAFVDSIIFRDPEINFPVYVQNDAEGDNGLLGDANEDGTVNIKDATCIQKHVANITVLSERGLVLADFDKSGDINIKDATAVQKFIAGVNA